MLGQVSRTSFKPGLKLFIDLRTKQGIRFLSSDGESHKRQRPQPRSLNLSIPSYVVWGSGTNVGKTLISAGICNFLSKDQARMVGRRVVVILHDRRGFPEDSDADTVAAVCGGRSEVGEHASQILINGPEVSYFPDLLHQDQACNVLARTEFAWSHAVGPHLAVQMEGRAVSDEQILQRLQEELSTFGERGGGAKKFAIIETAGAVNSPAPSGTSQVDLLRDLRLPGILIGDGQIGGISSTVSGKGMGTGGGGEKDWRAMESLLLRGIDISCIVMLDMGLRNEEAVANMVKKGFGGYTGKSIPVFGLPPLPRRRSNFSAAALRSWFLQCQDKFEKVTKLMEADHKERLQLLASAEERARSSVWWPFTQHDLVQSVTHIDARAGEDWWVYSKGSMSREAPPALLRWMDGAASWWTQRMDVGDMAMFCSQRTRMRQLYRQEKEDGGGLTERILKGPARGWGSRVFFSDDGSTAVEVALKMAMRKFMRTHSLLEKSPEELSKLKVRIMGLKGSYHGDTLGAMNAQAPSVFTGFKQMPWYDPKGVWLDIPTLAIVKGEWRIDLSAIPQAGKQLLTCRSVRCPPWPRRTESISRHISTTCPMRRLISCDQQVFDAYRQNIKIGALVLEIAMHGAGGMDFIDPLFQRILAEEATKRRIPVIADEVFSGMWRLGMQTACSMGGFHPDIACYSKLLTGGTVPLALTVASEDVFQAFTGSEKSEALLHGHSYTAHPIGCSVAIAAFDIFSDPELNPNLSAKQDKLVELWPMDKVVALSQRAVVKRVVPLGTVLVLELQTVGSSEQAFEGYASSLAKPYVEKLRERGIFLRPLGNVMYVMVTPTTSPSKCREILDLIADVIPA
ncbi:hypothetical protein GUITHDRAFT_161318 [Guillardia theta CCMP2712]|uniref:Adenosylmethionine-8-amino-7-oxononanoate aminotransferase n=1 Tax=Guillardia theta (strain CCMP2712) TaxID=905079 RepID=L1JVA5_GUITC|nr:hypothetical protein GUITHDRAFT_161318 [Guillardia theta CCMP2712]EKX52140.1 hypothetical protein GUITHDRAFT_161318 [Guillardia theta CCMP2712]|eukprot:XP_005839120.1 hypothetical protein GUITHDRAFT_161318 [Guillardia theta CCMP2712]